MGVDKKIEKKPYGLIYSVDTNGNPDGRLCVTLRKDDTPFEGVTSFAVEEGMTNLFGTDAWNFDSDQSTFYPDTLASGKTWEDCWDEKQHAYIGGQYLTTYRIKTKAIDLGQTYSAGTKVTVSWKHKGYLWYVALDYSENGTDFTLWNKDTDDIQIYGDASLDWWESTYGLHMKINGIRTSHNGHPEQLLDKWYDVKITYTLPTDARYIKFNWDFYLADQANNDQGVLGYIHQPQLEVKPFATSFVDGSRTYGKLVMPVNLSANNFVISFWHKRPFSGSQNRDVPFFELQDSNDNYLMIKAGYGVDFYIYTQDGMKYKSYFMPQAWYEDGEWMMFTFVASDDTWDVYIDDTKKASITAESVSYNRILIGNMEHNYNNYWFGGFFSNLYIGKAKVGDKLIWDDDYIKQLYQAKRPFSVPPKMPVI